jgi:hypothetical protein
MEIWFMVGLAQLVFAASLRCLTSGEKLCGRSDAVLIDVTVGRPIRIGRARSVDPRLREIVL